MEENRLENFKRRRDDSSDQADHAVSLLITPPGIQDSLLPGEDLENFSWKMNYSEMLAPEIDDCVSEALPQAKFVPSHDQKSPVLENQRQILADRVQRSIENLRVLYERLSNMVVLSEGPYCHGDSESCGLATERHGSDEGSSRWTSQVTQEALSPVSQGGESKYYREPGKPSSALKDLLSSLQFLLSIVKKHEEMQMVSQVKLQTLREQKKALRLEKQQYKDKYKRQAHVAECHLQSSVSQENCS